MSSWIWGASGVALAVAAFLGACGGTAIVDPPDGAAGGGSSSSGTSSSTSSSGGSTSVSSGCDCTTDSDCPDNFECQTPRCADCDCVLDDVPDGTACGANVCAGGECVDCIGDGDCGPGAVCASGSCVGDIGAVCDVTCTTITMCMGGVEPECFEACAMDLGDCSDAQVAQVAKCTDILLPTCDFDAWIGCMQDVGCLDF